MQMNHRQEESTMMLIEHFSWFDGVIVCLVAAVVILGLFTRDHDTAGR
jgi:hypothetical protein